MLSPVLALTLCLTLSLVYCHQTLTSTKLRVELGALSNPSAGVKLLNRLISRERQILDIYQDKALRCMLGADNTAATHWAQLKVHRNHIGDIEDIGGQLECESTLRRHAYLPDFYNDDDVADYRDWLMYDIIPFAMKRMPHFWLQGLHGMMDHEQESISHSNAFAQFSPDFRAKNPDEIHVCLHCD